MKRRHRQIGRQRWIVCGVLIAALTMALSTVLVSHAATVVLTKLHMTDQPGSNKAAVVHFSSGVKSVYFDYSVDAPYAADNGQVQVYRGGTTGLVLATSSLLFSVGGQLYAQLQPSTGGTWPDGSYCTVLLLDGVPDTANGQAPLAWTVGNVNSVPCPNPKSAGPGSATSPPATIAPSGSTTPTATPTGTATAPTLLKFRVSSHSVVRAHHSGNVRVTVSDSSGPVAGVTIKVNGRSAGIPKIMKGKTGAKGVATFHNVKPSRAGKLAISASKAGYHTSTYTLRVGG